LAVASVVSALLKLSTLRMDGQFFFVLATVLVPLAWFSLKIFGKKEM
jgi:uncharacterized membrane protein